jgi:hypothetical protein
MGERVLFDCGGETAASVAALFLGRSGFRVQRSFELTSAMAAVEDCCCPYHGTERCTCQFVVLLVYGDQGDPVVVTAHSRDTRATVEIVRDQTSPPDQRFVEQVQSALLSASASVGCLAQEHSQEITHAL